MPIYVYECRACNHSFEERQGFDAETLQSCPQCQSSAKRVFHASPIIFKGSGFYVTDYASKSSTMARKKAEESEKSGEPTGTTEAKDTKEIKKTELPKAAKPVTASKKSDGE